MKTELQSHELIALFRMCTSLAERLERSEKFVAWLQEQRTREINIIAKYVPSDELAKMCGYEFPKT